ncbi:MAG: hypothetical protein DPW22_10820 [Alphaproteobacteria bacterium]|nr:hypothetical protein [Alphaproteobacteria bacterium]
MSQAVGSGNGVTVITGASAGIGWHLARVFARHSHRLLLVARRNERLQQLAGEIAQTAGMRPHCLPLDLAQPDAPERIAARLAVRKHRYMPASLLASQFATLEAPDDALDIDVTLPLEAQVDAICAALACPPATKATHA